MAAPCCAERVLKPRPGGSEIDTRTESREVQGSRLVLAGRLGVLGKGYSKGLNECHSAGSERHSQCIRVVLLKKVNFASENLDITMVQGVNLELVSHRMPYYDVWKNKGGEREWVFKLETAGLSFCLCACVCAHISGSLSLSSQA
ncbi:hypothetical protein ElyMa_006326800 [Elysia marginata]|uniref:Uncharacterized protein n=1 Tax=Elysia marginata TaxID=1093978 RepID=A0AAV4HI71_9GAST|nr:hypothetical protein ElyMa_006326800 [Elysia marginata]